MTATQRNREMTETVDARMVAIAAQEGDPTAQEVIRISAEYLGRGLCRPLCCCL